MFKHVILLEECGNHPPFLILPDTIQILEKLDYSILTYYFYTIGLACCSIKQGSILGTIKLTNSNNQHGSLLSVFINKDRDLISYHGYI